MLQELDRYLSARYGGRIKESPEVKSPRLHGIDLERDAL